MGVILSRLTRLVLFSVVLTGLHGLSIASQSAARGENIHFRGPISAIGQDGAGSVVAITIQVNRAQANLVLNEWTELYRARGFGLRRDELRLGDFVEVSGFFTASGGIVAHRIHLESAGAVDAEGLVEEVSSNLLQVNGIEFKIDSASIIRAAGSETEGLVDQIGVGDLVRLRADYTAGELIVAELEFGKRTVETEPLRLEGTVQQFDSTLMTVDVGLDAFGALVAVDSSTEIQGTASPGAFVEVEGRFLPGTGLVKAARISTDDNSNGNVYDDFDEDSEAEEVELEGQIESLSLNGSSGSFVVNGNVVHFDSQTVIKDEEGMIVASGALELGQFVEVEGALLSDGSVAAWEVEIELEDDLNDDDGEDNGHEDDGEDDGHEDGDDDSHDDETGDDSGEDDDEEDEEDEEDDESEDDEEDDSEEEHP